MSYYLSLEEPTVIRKDLLMCAKDSVALLKAQYALRSLRTQKTEYLSQLADVVSEIAMMLEKLEKDLPAHEFDNMPAVVKKLHEHELAIEEREEKAEKKSTSSKKKAAKKGKVVPKEKPKPVSEPVHRDPEAERATRALNALEEKLASIEDKLNKL